ncbi:AMP-binding protein [Rhodococcus sp. IEGM 1381]|uniref:AMP-binding protein n=1 Tax=Rhodococcus sp. IEGM 1381 TaxID=3047085 RepID=UPI0024B6F66B|nr:AMP-binding protein [Rhodococcus sp. IEGM 1381]MDI9896885.1 AMP-binding protein [Rhodococcus sp. IEGM 1381]
MPLSPSAHVDTFCRDNLPPENSWPEFRFELPSLDYPERLNCATVLLDDMVSTVGPDKPCLLSPSATWTYGELLARANQVARVLTEDHGLIPGQRVLLRGPNNPWLVACWFAVVKAGGVVVTTMPMLRAPEITKIVDITTPTLVLCDHRFAAALADVVTTATVITFGAESDTDLTVRSATKAADFTNVDTAADDVVLLAPTSGTTGVPKATMHFHRDVLANADTFSEHVLKPTDTDVFTGTPPLAFTFGLGGLVIFPLRIGATTLLIEKATPTELAALVREHSVTVLFTAPTAYRAILAADAEIDLVSLRRCVSAGEHLPVAVWEQFHERTGIKLIDGIGATEMLHVFISAADDDIRPGATGRAVPGFDARIQDAAGNPLPAGTAGLLAVQGPTGCRYLADERQSVYVRDGWNVTGDTFVCDADGYFWYQARSDDMIVSSGYNIAAPEVEMAVDQHPAVAESAVIGIPDEARGMIVHAAIVLEPGIIGDDTLVAEIQTFVKSIAAPYKYPRSISFEQSLPRTESGKLQRFRLHERASTAS